MLLLFTDCTAGLTQGDGESQIDGNQLLLKSIYIRCGMTSNALVGIRRRKIYSRQDRMPGRSCSYFSRYIRRWRYYQFRS